MVESAIVRGLGEARGPAQAGQRSSRTRNARAAPSCLRILAELHPELARSRNEWEALVARRAKEAGLAPPHLEYELFIDGHRYIADAAWPDQRVALEFDGRDPHMRRRVHDYDTGRRNDFVDAGWKRFGITAAALKRPGRPRVPPGRTRDRRSLTCAWPAICNACEANACHGRVCGAGPAGARGQPSRAMGISAMTPSRMR